MNDLPEDIDEWIEGLIVNRYWDEHGFHGFEGRADAQLPWNEVRQLFVYKKDCFVVDLVCLLVLGEGMTLEFTEDEAGFNRLCEMAATNLGVSLDWCSQLSLSPAFQTTWTQVYPAATSTIIAHC